MSTSWHYQCIFCLWLLHSMAPVVTATNVSYNNFLPADMCTVKCGNRKHTLCTVDNPEPECHFEIFEHYRLDNFHTVNIKNFLVIGHNGLRDRIARHMNVTNMVQMHWDENLEEMASNYALRCTPFEDDECAQLKVELNYVEMFKYLKEVKDGEKFISMNRYCVKADYLPRDIIEITMRSWYFEKNHMKPPTVEKRTSHMQTSMLHEENNFTHLAFPLTYLIGCSFARYDNHFCIFCFYYPYYPTANNTMTFEYGDAGSDCPSMFPLRDEFFPGICIGDYFFGGAPTALNPHDVLMTAALLTTRWWYNQC